MCVVAVGIRIVGYCVCASASASASASAPASASASASACVLCAVTVCCVLYAVCVTLAPPHMLASMVGSVAPVHRYLVFVTDSTSCWSRYSGLVMTYAGMNPAPTGISLTAFTVPENSPAGFTIGTFAMSDVFGDTAAFWVVGGGNFALSGTCSVVGVGTSVLVCGVWVAGCGVWHVVCGMLWVGASVLW